MLRKWLLGLFGSSKPPVTPAHAAPTADEFEIVESIRAHVDAEIAGGFTPRDEIVQATVDYLEGEADEAFIRKQAEKIVAERLQAHAVRQASWTGPTDCDRLDAAFAELEAGGVISRQNFTCCGTCGSAEIWDEIQIAQDQGRPARGYAFFHMQDTESAVEGHGVYLNYGSCEGSEAATVAVGHDIVAHLNKHGLQTRWDGSIHYRIAVLLDWKRRRPDL